jgi:hypothetical protein
MPPDEPNYFKKIKLEKNVRGFMKSKKTKDKSNNFHVICD